MSDRGSMSVSSHRAMAIALTIFSLCALILLPYAAQAAPHKIAAHTPPAVAQKVRDGRIPLSFEPNQGQTDGRVSFLARGLGYALFLTPREAVLELKAAAGNQMPVVRMKLQGASPDVRKLAGIDELPGKANYLLGRDSSKWRTGIPTYGKVKESGVYPGINLVYYGCQR